MSRQNNRLTDKQAELLGAEILRAYAPDEETVAEAVASPFLFNRIKASIAAEVREREAAGGFWLGLFRGLSLALPAFALIAVFALGGAIWLNNETNSSATNIPNTTSSSLDNLLYDNSDYLFSADYGISEVKR